MSTWQTSSALSYLSDSRHIEVVLLLLVESFKFSLPKDKEIVWQMTGVVSPTVKSGEGSNNDQAGTPQSKMPLIVERV